MKKYSDVNRRDSLTEIRWNIVKFFFRVVKKIEKILFGRQPLTNHGYVPNAFPKSTVSKENLVDTDVIICVHNALEDVKRCIDSVLNHTLYSNIIIIDDGSASETQQYLVNAVKNHPKICLLRNEAAIGYTKSANLGLKHSTGSYMVLLNSDTIVSARWLERLLLCANSAPEIGIVGPLSNAAGWQSVPEVFDAQGGFMVNSLPAGYTAEQIDMLIEHSHTPIYPQVCLINGFCFLIKRSVVNTIGLFDEKAFPIGYNEEDDYCMRAREANIKLAIADNVYVYHAKSKTFGHAQRKLLSKQGFLALYRKHGYLKLYNVDPCMRWNPPLFYVRNVINEKLSELYH